MPAGAGSATAGSATVSLGEPVELVVAAPDFLGHGSKSDFSLKAQVRVLAPLPLPLP